MVIANMEIAEQLLCRHEERDVEAERFYREFQTTDGRHLSSVRIHDLTLKASNLNTIERMLEGGVWFQGQRYKVDLQDIAAQIDYLHKVVMMETYLPGNARRLYKLLIAYKKHGYIALMSRMELNQK